MNVSVFREAAVRAMVRVFQIVSPVLMKGGMTGEIGDVVGRIGEDKETKLDRACERTIVDAFAQAGAESFIIGEHGDYGSRRHKVTVIVDPFDGSGPIERGMVCESIAYSALAVFDEEGSARLGAVLDVKEKQIHLACSGKLTTFFLNEDGEVEIVREGMTTPRPKHIAETNVATYLLRWKYLKMSLERAFPIFELCERSGRLMHFNAGSFMAATMAAGKQGIGLYFLGGELLSETAIFMPFIKMARLHAVILEEDGSVRPFKFDPREVRDDPDRKYRAAPRMYLFVLGATKAIVEEAVQIIQEFRDKREAFLENLLTDFFIRHGLSEFVALKEEVREKFRTASLFEV